MFIWHSRVPTWLDCLPCCAYTPGASPFNSPGAPPPTPLLFLYFRFPPTLSPVPLFVLILAVPLPPIFLAPLHLLPCCSFISTSLLPSWSPSAMLPLLFLFSQPPSQHLNLQLTLFCGALFDKNQCDFYHNVE